jgi:hypothetical protein
MTIRQGSNTAWKQHTEAVVTPIGDDPRVHSAVAGSKFNRIVPKCSRIGDSFEIAPLRLVDRMREISRNPAAAIVLNGRGRKEISATFQVATQEELREVLLIEVFKAKNELFASQLFDTRGTRVIVAVNSARQLNLLLPDPL